MAAPDPAVRSIRIATTLAERFLALMHRRASPGDGTAELELQIGEAQQIYPEIWNHLDEARKVLAERGADTATYDEIKTAQGPVRMGVTRVEVQDHVEIGLGGYDHTQTKEAYFNLDGYRAAMKAIDALKAEMRGVDWKAVERDENREIEAAGSLSPVASKKTLVGIAIAAALVGLTYAVWYFVIRIPPHDPAEREAKRQADRAVRIADLRKTLEIDPCNPTHVRDLAFQLSFETPPQDAEAKKLYKFKCDELVLARTQAADANPCDENAVAMLVALLRPTKPKAARAAEATYRDLCASGKTGPTATPE